MRTALDTSVIIAGLLTWHEHHEPAARALKDAGRNGREIVLPVPTLYEAYSVMTRLPAPHRLRASDALALLEGTFRSRATVVGLSGEETWEAVSSLSVRGVIGGRAHDGHIVACARQAGAGRILTLNRRHFESLAEEDIEVVVPLPDSEQ